MSEKVIIKIHPLGELSPFGRSYGAFVDDELIDYHFCSNDSFAKYDLGDRRKNKYSEMFPNGFDVLFVDSIKEKRE